MFFAINSVKWEKTTGLSPFEKEHLVCARLVRASITKTANLTGFFKSIFQRFSQDGIRIYTPSLEDVTAIRAQFSKSVIGVISNELYGRAGFLL